MQRHSVAIIVAWTLLGVTANSRSQDNSAAKKIVADLQGVWKLVSIEHLDEVGEAGARRAYWVVKGDRIHYGGEVLATLAADGSTSPKCVDLNFHNPKAEREGIYEVRDGKWKLCINWDAEGVKERPQGFSTKDKPGFRGLVFEKADIKEADAAKAGMGFIGIAIGKLKEGGLFVAMVLPDSPAKKAGLAKDDQLLQVAGGDVGSLVDTVKMIQQVRPGSELSVRIKRGDKEMDIKLKAGLMPFHYLVQ